MKIEILPSRSKIIPHKGYERLSEKDFNHFESFFLSHPNLHPESIEEIIVNGVLEATKFPHVIIRQLDWILKTDGILIINLYNIAEEETAFHSFSMIRSLVSLCFENRIRLVAKEQSNYIRLTYIKTKASLPQDDSIRKWTFGICSDGRKNENILKIIKSIIAFNIPEVEILVCGPTPGENLPGCVRVIDDSPIYMEGDMRVPIGRKKNLIAKNAKYNNLLIMHDRYVFPNSWYENMKAWGNYYDMMTFPTCDVERPDCRVADWQYASWYNDSEQRLREKIVYPSYTYFDENVYINGGMFAIKKHIYEQHPIPESLHWAECEDLFLSKEMFLFGKMISIDVSNSILSENVRFVREPITAKTTWRVRLRNKRSNSLKRINALQSYAANLQMPRMYSLKEYMQYIGLRALWKISKLL